MQGVYRMISIGPVALLLAARAIPLCCPLFARYHAPLRWRQLAAYEGAELLWGAGAFVAGCMLGIALACSRADAGNLCGLVGVFGLGLLLAAAMIVWRLHSGWRSEARPGPSTSRRRGAA